MQFETFHIKGPMRVTPKVFADARGYFSETFVEAAFLKGLCREGLGEVRFVQDNESLSHAAGTVRGLHYQAPPRAQGKLVRCARGAVVDVAVDVRTGSPTYGEHIRVELSATNAHQLWIPEGFLHGFATQVPDTIVAYKVTDTYAPECDGSVAFDDPDLDIDWGVDTARAVLSDKDRTAPRFADWTSPFRWVGD